MQPCEGPDCFEIVEHNTLCDDCLVLALAVDEAVAAQEAVPDPESTPSAPEPVKARRAPRKASAKPAAEVDWKAMYQLTSQNIRAMCAAGAFIPGVMPKCSCPHCPDAAKCGAEQCGPMTELARRGEEMFDA